MTKRGVYNSEGQENDWYFSPRRIIMETTNSWGHTLACDSISQRASRSFYNTVFSFRVASTTRPHYDRHRSAAFQLVPGKSSLDWSVAGDTVPFPWPETIIIASPSHEVCFVGCTDRPEYIGQSRWHLHKHFVWTFQLLTCIGHRL
jgi:hypothetical protein